MDEDIVDGLAIEQDEPVDALDSQDVELSDDSSADIELPDAESSDDEDSDDEISLDESSDDEELADIPDMSDVDVSEDNPSELGMFDDQLLDHGLSDEENPDAASATESSPKMTKHDPLVFDEEGDLHLEVGEKKISCRVCSKSLARASRVFKRMLYGGFSESRDNSLAGEWVVQLPDDDINAMKILLAIIHGCPQTVPKKLPTMSETLVDPTSYEFFHVGYADAGLLYLVTLAADKYGLTPILKPWVESWLDEFRHSRRWTDKWCGEVLWAAWLLGDDDLVSNQLDLFVIHTIPETDGDDKATDEFSVYDAFDEEIHASDTTSITYQILDILGVWKDLRVVSIRLLKLYIDHFKSFLDEPLTYMDAGCAWHMQAEGPGTDRTVVLETLQGLLARYDLFPLPEPQDWMYSVGQAQFCIENLAPKMMLPAEVLFKRYHCRGCRPYRRLLEAVRDVQGNHSLIHLSASQRVHLSRKRKESEIREPRR